MQGLEATEYEGTHRCPKCKEIRRESQFYRKKDGTRNPPCKVCRNMWSRQNWRRWPPKGKNSGPSEGREPDSC
jgi:hypothetical protein